MSTDDAAATLPDLLTLAEAAKLLRVSKRALHRWRAMGLIKTIRPCGGWPLVARSEIERVLRDGASQ
jgi:excisionase family DNA binding protein